MIDPSSWSSVRRSGGSTGGLLVLLVVVVLLVLLVVVLLVVVDLGQTHWSPWRTGPVKVHLPAGIHPQIIVVVVVCM